MYSQNTWIRLGVIYMTGINRNKAWWDLHHQMDDSRCKIAEWMEEHNIKEGKPYYSGSKTVWET